MQDDLEKVQPAPLQDLQHAKDDLTIPSHLPHRGMSNSTDKHPLKSKTVWGLLTTLLGAIALALGWPSDSFQFLADGLQLADVGAIITLVGFLWSQYGQRVAKQGLTHWTGSERKQ